MSLHKSLLAVAVVSLASATANATPYVGSFFPGNAYLPTLAGVTGFDVQSNGATAFFCQSAGGCGAGALAFGAQLNPAATTQLIAGDIIRSVYQGVVSGVNPGVAAPLLFSPGNEPAAGFQLTIAATFDEVVVFGVAGPGFASAILSPLNGGRVSLFYDVAGGPGGLADGGGTLIGAASVAGGLGTGYTDGLLIADGTVNALASLPTNVNSNGTSASGSANIAGSMTATVGDPGTNTVGFIPAPTGFQSTTTLQYGPNTGGYQVSNFFDTRNGWTAMAVNAALTERADANVDLTAVPEPGSLALVGLALAGVGFSMRRRGA